MTGREYKIWNFGQKFKEELDEVNEVKYNEGQNTTKFIS